MYKGREVIFYYLTREKDGTWNEMVAVEIDGAREPVSYNSHETFPESYRQFFIFREDLSKGDDFLVFQEPSDSRG
ncbi:MAG: hypothetical protein GX825_08250 [Syntrophomonadaceae bacterium]|nr:hypothetical protein [Syntrophomonadaceae bacterium]